MRLFVLKSLHLWKRCLVLCLAGGWLVLQSSPATVQAAPKTEVTAKTTLSFNNGLSRQQAIAYALRYNPKWLALRAKLKTALSNLRGARVFPSNPVLGGKGKGKAKPSGSNLKTSPYMLDMELSWKLPVGGWWSQNIVLARQTLKRVKRELAGERWALTLKVHKAYNKVLLARRKVRVYQQIVGTFEEILEATKRRLREGALTRFNLINAQVSVLNNRTSLIAAKVGVKIQRRKLQELLGWKARRFPRLTSPMPRPNALTQTLVVLQSSLPRHPWLQIAKQKIVEARARLKVAQGKAFPDLKLKLVYSYEEGDVHKFGGGFELPIPLLFRNQTKIWTSRAKIREAVLKRKALLFQLKLQTQQEYLRFQMQQKIWKLYQKQLLPITRTAVKLRKLGLQAGAIPVLRVLSAQKTLQKALIGQIKALETALTTYLSLCRVRGVVPRWR